jgi:hypothetical protein
MLCAKGKEAMYTHIIVFGLSQSGLKLMIYHTQGKHAKHYTTDHVLLHYFVYHLTPDKI